MTNERAVVSHLVTSLKRCKSFEAGRKLHLDVFAGNFDANKYVTAALMKMYSRCGRMQDAQQIFDRTPELDVVIWTTLILGYVDNGEYLQAMDLFTAMNCEPDTLTFVAVLKACAGLVASKESESSMQESYICEVMELHEDIKLRGFSSDVLLANTLLDVYCTCGLMQEVRKIFVEMTHRNVASWTSVILGHVENGESLIAMDFLTGMDCEPDSFTYLASFKACGALAGEKELRKEFCLEKGIAIHKQARDSGVHLNMVVATTLLDMYTKCGSMNHAREVFDTVACRDVVTWTSLILGYVEKGECALALELFTCMECLPNSLTYVAVLKACARSVNSLDRSFLLEKAILFHKNIKELGYDSDIVVATSLVDVYSKCGSMKHAKEVFDGMIRKDIVVWTSLIQGYAENGESLVALNLFTFMDCKPNSFTCVASLKACGNLVALPAGKYTHARITRLGLEQYRVVGTALIDFYGKCGNMSRAEECFNIMQHVDSVSWSIFISGFSSAGDSLRVISLVRSMEEAGLGMDGSLLSCVLTACSHAGSVEDAKFYFQSMLRHGVVENVEHYNCIVDALCRANKLDQAAALVSAMPVDANTVTWKTLLGSSWNRSLTCT